MKVPVLGVTFCIFVLTIVGAVEAHDDGRYAHSPLKPWFDGLCCSDADGFAVSDPDWESKDGHYPVRVEKRVGRRSR